MAFLGDGKRAVTASDDKTAILWDLATRSPIRQFNGHGAKVMAVAVSADGALLATGGWDHTLRIWDVTTGEARHVIEQPSNVNAVAFTPDGKTVLAGAHDGGIRVWSTETGGFLGRMKGHDWGVTQIAVSPDGRRALSSSTDATIRLWDIAGGSEIRQLKRYDVPVFDVAFAPDGKTALSAGRDGYVVHWDLASGKPIREISAHDAPVWSVAFSPDGRFAVSASSDERVRIWHLATGDQIGIEDEGVEEPKPWLESSHPGARLFRKCARCHSLISDGPRRSGPHFVGLFGRRVGSLPGYNYSAALKGRDFEWNADTLRALFTDGPDVYLPGTKMPVQRVPDEAQLADLIDYLAEITPVVAPPE